MRAPFLLDNNYDPAMDMSDLYRQKISSFYEEYSPGQTKTLVMHPSSLG